MPSRPPQNDNGAFQPCSPDHVGTLYVYSGNAKASREWKLFANEELIVGRNANSWWALTSPIAKVVLISVVDSYSQLVIDDPTVSNTHLRIYTIIFDQENPSQVAPLVYVQDLSLNGAFWNGIKIGKGNAGFLLSDGDMVEISSNVILEYSGERVLRTPFDKVQIQEMKSFEDQYVITNRTLGCGAYGRVHMSIDKKKKRQLACKVVNLADLKARLRQVELEEPSQAAGLGLHKTAKRRRLTYKVQAKLKMYDREVEILQKLRHPNIISIEKVFKTHNTIYIFQDLVTAGDLFSFLEFKNGKLLDVEAAVIIRQVVIALAYLHNQNVVHRDLKPDNVLMTSLSNGSRVILTDFGCARYLNPKKSRMASVMGTLEYTAPEMGQGCHRLAKGYTKSVDLWSLGCLTVVLLTGGSPFSDPATGKYCGTLAKQCNLDTLEQDNDWQVVGERAKQFVRGLLVLNDEQRMTADEALKHDWFTNIAHSQAFEDLYMRAIQGWEPRDEKSKILYDMRYMQGSMGEYSFWQGKTSMQLPSGSPGQELDSLTSQEEIERSPYFSMSRRNPKAKLRRNVSITLSDPGNKEALRVLNNSTDASPPRSPQGSTAQEWDGIVGQKTDKVRFEVTSHDDAADHQAKSCIRNPFSPEAWHKSDHEPVQRLKGTRSKKCMDNTEHEQPEAVAKSEWGLKTVENVTVPSSVTKHGPADILNPVRADALHMPIMSNLKSLRSWPHHDTESDIFIFQEDEVYEEVFDPVTGKHRPVRYGER
ncbi:putative non-specific serine/threonine protein kinase [Microsporum audouinii]